MDIVLVHPDIPFNTGNVARTCVATGCTLHLIEPLGFSIEDRWLKRAGLDYWKDAKVVTYKNLDEFFQSAIGQKDLFFFSRFAKKLYWEAKYPKDAVLVFGSETKGLPDEIKEKFSERLFRIPTPGPVRSLNLSTSVGITLFEAIRQNAQNPLDSQR